MNKELEFKFEDFFPYYETDKDLYLNIAKKREYNELALQDVEEFPNIGFNKPQKFMSRFINKNTPYDSMLVYHEPGTGKCVMPDTEVTLYNMTTCKIKDLFDEMNIVKKDEDGGEWCKTSKQVICYNPNTKSFTISKINHVYRQPINEKILRYFTSNNIKLDCTKAHKLLLEDGHFKNDCTINDKIVTMKGYDTIVDVKEYLYEGFVYDLEVDIHHTYIANGIVTHNTCLSIAVAEFALKNEDSIMDKIFIVTKDTLKGSFEEDLKSICNSYKYKLTEEQRKNKDDKTIGKMEKNLIKKDYSIMSYTEFAKKANVATDDILHQLFDNSYIFIDEVHNLNTNSLDRAENANNEAVKRATVESNLKSILNVVKKVRGSRIILLSGTPITDRVSEIVTILKLLNKDSIDLDKSTFEKNWLDPVTNKLRDDRRIEFIKKYLYGKVSYLRQPISAVKITEDTNINENPDFDLINSNELYKLNYIKTIGLLMDKFQGESFEEAYTKDSRNKKGNEDGEDEDGEDEDDGKKKGIWKHANVASNIVNTDGSYEDFEKENLEIIRITEAKDARIKNVKLKQNSSIKRFLQGNLEKLKQLSIKFYYIIKSIKESNGQKIFIFSDKVTGGGVLMLAALLNEFGLEKINADDIDSKKKLENKPRYAIFTQATSTNQEINKILNFCNDKNENLYGEKLQVIIGSEKISEGFNIKHIRKVFILKSMWNLPRLDQALYRAIRSKGHDDLPLEKRTLDIYRLASYWKDNKNKIYSLDYYMYHKSEIKDIKVKSIERLLKEAAVDCSNNIKQNMSIKGVDNTRYCDYQSCQYKCYGLDDKYMVKRDNSDLYYFSIPSQEWDFTTYNLYYAETEISDIISRIKILFRNKMTLHFSDILQYINQINPIVIARALTKIIYENEQITNKFGFINYLREDNNYYFLIDDPMGYVKSSMTYYASNPIIETVSDMNNSLRIANANILSKIIAKLDVMSKSNKTDDEKIKNITISLNKISPKLALDFYINSLKTPENELSTLGKYLKRIITKNISDAIRLQDNQDIRVYSITLNEKLYYIDVNTNTLITNIKVKVTEEKMQMFEYFEYYANSVSDKTLSIIKYVKQEGKIDLRIADKQGTACGTGLYSVRRLYELIMEMSYKGSTYKGYKSIITWSADLKLDDKFKNANGQIVPNSNEYNTTNLVDMDKMISAKSPLSDFSLYYVSIYKKNKIIEKLLTFTMNEFYITLKTYTENLTSTYKRAFDTFSGKQEKMTEYNIRYNLNSIFESSNAVNNIVTNINSLYEKLITEDERETDSVIKAKLFVENGEFIKVVNLLTYVSSYSKITNKKNILCGLLQQWFNSMELTKATSK